jgi:hypothetical protein
MTAPDRLSDSLRRVNGALNPRLAYLAQWEYQVISATPGPPVTIDCSAVDAETQDVLPSQLVGLVLWPGSSGIVSVPQPGSIVRVSFVNGDPSKPTVVGLDPNGTPLLAMGFVSTVLRLGDQSAAPLVPATWGAGLATDLTVFAAAMAAAATGPLAPMAAPATALQTAIAALPPVATTKLLGT